MCPRGQVLGLEAPRGHNFLALASNTEALASVRYKGLGLVNFKAKAKTNVQSTAAAV